MAARTMPLPERKKPQNLNTLMRALTSRKAGGTGNAPGIGNGNTRAAGTGRAAAAATMTAARFERLTVIQQVRRSFLPGARLAGVIGLVLGGFVPVATYTVARIEVHAAPWLWLLVLGGMVYSAVSVFTWARAAFGSTSKALGFVVLLEGTLVFGTVPALSLAALGVLVFINAVAAACALQVRRDDGKVTYAARRQSGALTTLWLNR